MSLNIEKITNFSDSANDELDLYRLLVCVNWLRLVSMREFWVSAITVKDSIEVDLNSMSAQVQFIEDGGGKYSVVCANMKHTC